MDGLSPQVQEGLTRFFNLKTAAQLPRVADETVDPLTGVLYRDVLIDASTNVSARLYLPNPEVIVEKKLPIFMYVHGGGFFMGSPYDPMYHNYLVSVVAAASVVAVSIQYRLAPSHLLPSAYDDAFTAFGWILSRADPWLAERGDYERLFVAGDSAGANIVHNLTMKGGVRIEGMILAHPYFWGSAPIDGEITFPLLRYVLDWAWHMVSSDEISSLDHPSINPVAEGAPNLAGLGCKRAMVFLAEVDPWLFRGRAYYEALTTEGGTEAAVLESTGPDATHVFHIANPGSELAAEVMRKLVGFIHPK